MDSSHFPQFDFDVLLEVLSADELSVKFEKQALRAAELWLESTERNERTCSILSKIRYLYLTPEVHINVQNIFESDT